MKKDIENEKDIQLLVNAFYKKVMKEPSLSPFFEKVDFEKHLPKMIQFWSFAILEIPGYTTNLFDTHKNMPLKKEQFSAWLGLFNETIDEMYSGVNTEKAKQKAQIIAISMESKMIT